MSLRRALCAAVLALVMPLASHAAPGVNLAWNDCAIDGGAFNVVFDCTNNSPKGTLIVSWVPAVEVPQLNGAEAFVDCYFDVGTVPAWWGNGCTGKTVPVSVNTVAPSARVHCIDAWNGNGLSVLAVYSMPLYIQHGVVTPGPANSAQIDAVGALLEGFERDLLPGNEYYLFSITVAGTKTTGTGACTGCSVSARLNAQCVWVTQPAPAPHQEIYTQGAQSWVLLNALYTPTESHTWGALKAMYR